MNNNKQNHKVKVLCVPNICSKIKGQNLSCVIKNYDFIRQLQLADTIFNGETNVDILIGADLYWQFVTGETKRSEKCNLVAINSIFGWVISGPNECVNGNHNSTVCTSTAHVLKISCNENEMLKLNENIIDVKRFGSCKKLIQVTTWVLRFVKNIKSKITKIEVLKLPYLNNDEFEYSKKLWLLANQKELLTSDRFRDLQNSLRLELFDDGFYRSTGRLSYGKSLPYSLKEPILLKRDHFLTRLIVWDAHLKVKHNGERQTLAEVRNEYWIPRGKSLVKQILKQCITCRKLNARPYNYPQSPNLPSVRLNEDNCLSGIGVDYSGAVYCKNVFSSDNVDEDDMYKCYIVIYTCASTRGVVLDVVPDGTAETFIYNLRKFISRRGCPKVILSDNGGLFIADSTQLFVNQRNIKWDFSLPKAPCYGGFWERLIGQVKRCLKKVLGRTSLDFYQLQTLNSRPLGVLYDDDMEQILTPNHLLFGQKLNIENIYGEFQLKNNINLKKYKEYIDNLLTHFWNRWRSEYVPSLREFHKLYRKTNNIPNVGDIVNIYEEKQPRQTWLLGRIISLIKGKDDQVRGAVIFLDKTRKTIETPINKLYPVEFQDEFNRNDDVNTNSLRPKRNAAIIGELKRKFNS